MYPIENAWTTAETIVTTQNMIDDKGSINIEKFKETFEKVIQLYTISVPEYLSIFKYIITDKIAATVKSEVEKISAFLWLELIIHNADIIAPNKGKKTTSETIFILTFQLLSIFNFDGPHVPKKYH